MARWSARTRCGAKLAEASSSTESVAFVSWSDRIDPPMIRETATTMTTTAISPATLKVTRNPGRTRERNPEKSEMPGRLCFAIYVLIGIRRLIAESATIPRRATARRQF
jgi:hypothetical protein